MKEVLGLLSSRVLIHASCVQLAAATVPFGGYSDGAVLLLGESGSGKSDVALRLIAAGAKLIADDQTALFNEEGRVFAEAPAHLRGLMEIRGIGILNMDSAARAPLVLAVQLFDGSEVDRLPEPSVYTLPGALQAPVNPPLLMLNAFEASTPAKIAAAAGSIARGGSIAGALSSW